MIRDEDLRLVGKMLKPHGICGEVTVLLTEDVDLSELSCIMLKLDGIFVPFFLSNVRPKSSETDLVTIDGVTDEVQAADLCPNDVYALASEVGGVDEGGGEGMYASDMQGYSVYLGEELLGEISGIDDSTENYLFIVEKPSGDTCLVPVVNEFIMELNPDEKIIVMDLPTGLVDLNVN